MSSSSDWHSGDHHTVSLPTIVSSSDLFDGELFGDELMDIYNHNDSIGHDITSLLPNADDGRRIDEDANDILAAIDEGFASFRPSTSFNDLTSLLAGSNPEPSSITPGATAETSGANNYAPAAPTPQVVTSSVVSNVLNDRVSSSKKRMAEAPPIPAPSAKKSNAVRRVSVTKKSSDFNGPATQALQRANENEEKDDTPNPLVVTSAPTMQSLPMHMPPKTVTVVMPKPAGVAHNVTMTKDSVHSSSMSIDSCVSRSASESDFKQIAQAAVSNLILSAATGNDDRKGDAFEEKVDTSTSHIKALTGNNWVAACSGSSVGGPSSCAADSKANRARRQNLTPDERARQNRDRNREHARNTRLRKKAYVEELKRTLTELVAQRDAADLEKRQAAQRELEQREVRFRVIEEFLKLRGRNETNFARWAAILEDGFSFFLPIFEFKKLEEGNMCPGFEQVLKGVSNVMGDASAFNSFLQTFGKGEGNVSFHYFCDRKNFFMDGCNAFLEWSGSTVGASSELTIKGVLRAKFSPASNKLMFASMTFDSSAILIHLRKSTSSAVPTEKITDTSYDVAAAQADALLDSLQMPCLSVTVPTSVNVVHPSSSSEGSCEKGELDSDDSVSESMEKNDSHSGKASTTSI
jgi:hypothetical protein